MLGIEQLSIWTFSLQNSCHRMNAKMTLLEKKQHCRSQKPLENSLPSFPRSLRARSGRLTIRLVQFIVLRQPNKVYRGLPYILRRGIGKKFLDICSLDFRIGRWKNFSLLQNPEWHLCLSFFRLVRRLGSEKTFSMSSLQPAVWNCSKLSGHLQFRLDNTAMEKLFPCFFHKFARLVSYVRVIG